MRLFLFEELKKRKKDKNNHEKQKQPLFFCAFTSLPLGPKEFIYDWIDFVDTVQIFSLFLSVVSTFVR